jgi:hypothetical protein
MAPAAALLFLHPTTSVLPRKKSAFSRPSIRGFIAGTNGTQSS